MNPDLSNATMAVGILQWFLELAAVHPVKFSVLFAVMSISGIVGAASLLVEPLLLVHNYLESSDPLPQKSRGRGKARAAKPSTFRRTLKVLVDLLSIIARNP